MLRTYRLPSKCIIDYELEVKECSEPDTVLIVLGSNNIALDRETFKELAGLASYSTYGDSVNFVKEEEEVQD
jgi:hypothetical protein